MRTGPIRLFVGVAVAAVALAASVATASASTGLSITNGTTLITANGATTFNFGGAITDVCTVRLGFGLNRSVAKRLLAQIGTILPSPVSTIPGCDLLLGATILSSITFGYIAFTGVLPSIQRIEARSNNFAMLLDFPIIGSCLYSGPLNMQLNRSVATGAITSVAIAGTITSPDGDCPRPLTLASTLTVLTTQPIIQLI